MKALRGFVVAMLFIPVIGFSQQTDTLVQKLDSAAVKSDSLNNTQKNNTTPASYEDIKLDARDYLTLLSDDIKQQLTLPFHIKGNDWVRTAGFAAVTGGVYLLDKPINRFTKNLTANNPAVASVSKYVTNFGGNYELYTLAGFYAYGLVFKTQKEKTTTALATQAYISAGLIQVVTKFVTGEQRPHYVDPVTGKSAPIWHGPMFRFKKNSKGEKPDGTAYSSFPSGHTTAAFAAATVYALEYKNSPFIPILSYSAATLIGLSRLTENKHWASDILVGGMLGYLCGKQVVNNYHRFARLKKGDKKLKDISFNLQYIDRQIVPGLVYRF